MIAGNVDKIIAGASLKPSLKSLNDHVVEVYSRSAMEAAHHNAAFWMAIAGPSKPVKPLTKRQKLAKKKREARLLKLQKAHDRLCKQLGCAHGDDWD